MLDEVSDAEQGEKPVNLIILAGGRGTRMGTSHKHEMMLAGKSLYDHVLDRIAPVCDSIIVVGSSDNTAGLARPHVRVVCDAVPGEGPLGGIWSGLRASSSALNLIMGADMPCGSPTLAQAMEQRAITASLDILYPSIDGLVEPLFAIYSRRVADIAGELLAAGRHSVRGLFKCPELNIGIVDRTFVQQYDAKLASFFNVNTSDDLVMAEYMLTRRKKCLQEEQT